MHGPSCTTSTLRVSASFDQVDEQIQTHLRMSGTLGTFRVPMKKQTSGLRCMDPSPTCSPRGYPLSASGGQGPNSRDVKGAETPELGGTGGKFGLRY